MIGVRVFLQNIFELIIGHDVQKITEQAKYFLLCKINVAVSHEKLSKKKIAHAMKL